jgi:A/G-specific adenine glycosylase
LISFRSALNAWYRENRRSLPWRDSPSLYKTVVSEFMLQQTQVKTVLPYFARWLKLFPDFAALAAASPADVLKAWEGLGYYSRARNLHRLAQTLAARASPPATPEKWLELPGIGPYTAAAVTSIAFGYPTACVDGNVVRILARISADGTVFRDSASAAKALSPLAERLMGGRRPEAGLHPGDHNQAMMELGATVCTKHNPQCLLCPVRAFCAAGRAGNPEDYPKLAAKVIEYREVVRVWCMRGGRLLLHRAADASKRLAGQHELPTAEQTGIAASVAAEGPLLAKKTRSITRYRIAESIHAAEPPEFAVNEAAAGGQLVWASPAELGQITLSGPHRRWVAQLLRETGAESSPRDVALTAARPRRRCAG